MLKKIVSLIFTSTILFCVVSFLSVFFSLLLRKRAENPTVNIGFPLKYYEQFWMDKNDLHHGWNLKNFILDFIIALTIVLLAKFIRSRKRNQV